MTVAFLATVALAQSGEAVRFDYRAPPGCPDAEAFASRVESRTRRARPGEPGELARTFTVDVRVEANGASARLSFTDSRGAPVVRAVRGETCDEVVSAIALVTALAIEAGPTEAGAPTPRAETSPGLAASSGARPAPARPKKSAPRAPEPDVVAWSLGIETGVTSWLGPGANLGVGAFAEVGTYAGASARLTLLRATSGALVERDPGSGFRRADFTALVARVEGCPLAAALGSGFRVIPCAALGLGQLEGEGQKKTVRGAKSQPIFWADFVPTLRLDWTLADSLVFFTQGELGVPLRAREFVFEAPHQRVFLVPRVGVGAALGMSWRFP